MKISIITPSYNQVQFIERTIKSVLEQTDVLLEYIVVDDYSTDGTREILAKYTNLIIILSGKREGQSKAVNKGLRRATGDIVCWLNSDDTFEPDAFRKVVEFFETNPNTTWLYGKCRIIDTDDNEIRKPITWYKNILLKNFSYTKLLTENFISQPTVFWRRELLDEIGYLNEDEYYCMDYEYWLKIGRKYTPGIIPEYLANFRRHTQSKSSLGTKKQFKDELRVARKILRIGEYADSQNSSSNEERQPLKRSQEHEDLASMAPQQEWKNELLVVQKIREDLDALRNVEDQQAIRNLKVMLEGYSNNLQGNLHLIIPELTRALIQDYPGIFKVVEDERDAALYHIGEEQEA